MVNHAGAAAKGNMFQQRKVLYWNPFHKKHKKKRIELSQYAVRLCARVSSRPQRIYSRFTDPAPLMAPGRRSANISVWNVPTRPEPIYSRITDPDWAAGRGWAAGGRLSLFFIFFYEFSSLFIFFIKSLLIFIALC